MTEKRKGIVLAGGTGSRLHPITATVSKQLLPIYDKPMIYYPISILMLSGIREIAIITSPEYLAQFKQLLGNGHQWGLKFKFIEQPTPDGLTQAYILAESFLNGSPSAMILGDNIFYGHGITELLKSASANYNRCTAFCYRVANPERYGIVNLDRNLKPIGITEKPKKPTSHFAITGLYFLDGNATQFAKEIKPSARGELEITDLLKLYLKQKILDIAVLGRGFSWFDAGTNESLLEASNFVRTIQNRQGLQIGCIEEISFLNRWINKKDVQQASKKYRKNNYGKYLENLI